MDPLTLLIIAGSAGLKALNNRAAAQRQESLRRAMEAYQQQRARETEGATEQLIAKQSPKERATELSQVTDDRTQSLRDTVGAAQAFDTAPIAGKVSDDYKAAQQATAERVAERTRRAITQLATMGAPSEQQQAFSRRFGVASGRVQGANRASENVGQAYTTDIGNVRANPFVDLVSQVGMGVGLGMAAGGGAAAPAEAGGSGLTPGTAGEGLRVGAGEPGLRAQSEFGIRPRLKYGFGQYGLTSPIFGDWT